MFEGEAASLEAILKTAALRVPRPVKVSQYVCVCDCEIVIVRCVSV